jgi:thiamine biosynthesis lipoprotein
MGTFVHITFPKQYNKQISQTFAYLRTIEHSLSSYEDHLVYRLNQNHTIPYDAVLAEALQLSRDYYAKTNGYFDITIGSISKDLYHFGEDNSTVPTKNSLEKATLNIDAIELNTTSISTGKNITLDLGGMGKGFAVDKAVAFIKEHNITQGIIALSGDIRCLDLCDIDIQSPFKEEESIASFSAKIPNLSISTSGTYRRYVKEKSQHHLISPKSKTQGRDFISVTIISQANNTLCDIMATAIATMPKEEALTFVKNQKEFGYLLLTPTGEEISGNLEKFVERHK